MGEKGIFGRFFRASIDGRKPSEVTKLYIPDENDILAPGEEPVDPVVEAVKKLDLRNPRDRAAMLGAALQDDPDFPNIKQNLVDHEYKNLVT